MITARLIGDMSKTVMPDPQPDILFHDSNVYCYRHRDGVMVLRGVILADGWENRMTFDGHKLSCYREREDINLDNLKEARPDKDEIMMRAKEIMAGGAGITQAAKELDVPVSTLHGWLSREKRRAEKKARFEGVLNSVDAGKSEKPMGVVEAESHSHHINQVAPIGVEVPQYEPTDNAWQLKDEKPIPHQVAETFDAGRFKLELIQSVIEVVELRKAPKDMTLNLISGIIGS